jgi:hypothetical protein
LLFLRERQALLWEDWRKPLHPSGGSGFSDHRVLSSVVLAIFAVLSVIFR